VPVALVAAVRFRLRFPLLAREPIHRFVVFPGIASRAGEDASRFCCSR
jgi:hypothetical protein